MSDVADDMTRPERLARALPMFLGWGLLLSIVFHGSCRDCYFSSFSIRLKVASRQTYLKAAPFAACLHCREEGWGVVVVMCWLGWLVGLSDLLNF